MERLFYLLENVWSDVNKVAAIAETQMEIYSKTLNDIKLLELKPANIDDFINNYILLFQHFEKMCIFLHNDENVLQLSIDSGLFQRIDLNNILLKFDKLAYQIYHYLLNNKTNIKNFNKILDKLKSLEQNKNETLKDFFNMLYPDSVNLFCDINSTMLLPTKEFEMPIVPKNLKVSKYNISNTTNIVFDLSNLVDQSVIWEKFGNLKINSGLNLDIIDRFHFYNIYDPIEESEKIVFNGDPAIVPDIYQYLGVKNGKKYYRKLIDYPKQDTGRHYSYMGSNIYTSNMENKRFYMLKINSPTTKWKKKLLTPELHGKIKTEFYQKKKRISSAVFDAVYSEDLNDNQILNLIGMCSVYSGEKIKKELILNMNTFRDLNSI